MECHDIGFKDKSGPCYGNSSTGGNLGSIMESDVSDVMLHDDIVESTCSDVVWMQGITRYDLVSVEVLMDYTKSVDFCVLW